MIHVKVGDPLAIWKSISPAAAKGTSGVYTGRDADGKRVGVEVFSYPSRTGRATTVNQWDIEGNAHGTSHFAHGVAFYRSEFARSGDSTVAVSESDDNGDSKVDTRWTSLGNGQDNDWVRCEKAQPDGTLKVVYDSAKPSLGSPR